MQVTVALDFSALNAMRFALINWIESSRIQRVQFIDEDGPREMAAKDLPDMVWDRVGVSMNAYRSGTLTGEAPGTPLEHARRRVVGLVTSAAFKYQFRIAFGGGIWAYYDDLPLDRQRDLALQLSLVMPKELFLWADTEDDRRAIEDREWEQHVSEMSPTLRAAMTSVLAQHPFQSTEPVKVKDRSWFD